MTVYTGRTFQSSALRVWGVWVSMRDFHAAMIGNRESLPFLLTNNIVSRLHQNPEPAIVR
jgi:hypothetical protein